MVYGNRNNRASITMGVARRGTPSAAKVSFSGSRRCILQFHTHPPLYKPLPSTGDVIWVMIFHDQADRWGTFEAFAIGSPFEKDEGRIMFYMVTDWGYMRRVCDEIADPDREYVRYLKGLRPDIPKEVYEAHDYLWSELPNFTEPRYVKYHPPIEFPEMEVSRYKYIEPYTRDDIAKIAELMARFPEVEHAF